MLGCAPAVLREVQIFRFPLPLLSDVDAEVQPVAAMLRARVEVISLAPHSTPATARLAFERLARAVQDGIRELGGATWGDTTSVAGAALVAGE